MPGIADNALVKAARLIERIAGYRPEPQIQQEVEAFLRAVLGEVPPAGDVVERARARASRSPAELIEPLLAPTFSPTMISASQQAERHPRALRGRSSTAACCRARRRRRSSRSSARCSATTSTYDLEFLEAEGGTRSRARHAALVGASSAFVARARARRACRCRCICAGFTDSHWLREAFGTVAYGFFPYARRCRRSSRRTLIHSADERVPVADLELGVDWLRHAARAVCA